MSAPRHRALRFLLPDLDAPEEQAGLQLDPLRGRAQWVDEAASIRQAILLLLSTSPGERVLRPAYGCDLNRLVFSPLDDTTAGLAIYYVRRALEAWEPRIDVLNVDTEPGMVDGGLYLRVEYRVRATQRRDELRHFLPLSGERT